MTKPNFAKQSPVLNFVRSISEQQGAVPATRGTSPNEARSWLVPELIIDQAVPDMFTRKYKKSSTRRFE